MIVIDRTRIDSRTPEGRKALRLMTVDTVSIVSALGLSPLGERPVYTKAELCLMAVAAGLSPKDFHRN